MKRYFLILICCHLVSPVALAQLPQLSPESLGLDGGRLEQIDQVAAEGIESGNMAGCVVAVGRQGGIGFLQAYGNRQVEPSVEPMTVDTVFDLASITKPVATATSVMHLLQQGKLRLRAEVADYLPEFGQNGKEKITIEQLLTHQGGLIPDNALEDYRHGADEAWRRIYALTPRTEPGTQFIYTDVGYLVLAEVVRAVSGQPIDEFAAQQTFEPLGMDETGYNPPPELQERAAATEQQDGKWLKGTVHDPRAALLDGVAGHAGLFSTAADLALYANDLLRAAADTQPETLASATLREMIRPRKIGRHLRGLGWDVNSGYSSNRGENFSQRAFGHGGFTGTAMWIDPELDLFVIFLSNRLHPDGKGNVNPLAGRVGAIAAAAIDGPNPVQAASGEAAEHDAPTGTMKREPVLPGIDVLQRDQFKLLAGRRVGLITNHTGVNREGRRTIDLLHEAPEVNLVAIFSPEHGIAGKFDQPEIGDAEDESTGIPIYSLYGESRRPDPEELKQVEVLVFDIQDIGARFYTYISTMGLAMEAAAEQDVAFVVLDRPNPLGGVDVGGPLLDVGRESFVGYHQMAIRHGMTVGELAKMFRDQREIDVDLEVVEVAGWRRDELWDRTGLTWVNPSPNMRSLTEAILYPGVGLIETTNVSVGRGTDTPFELFGAPWIDRHELAAALNEADTPGVRFIPIRFTPESSKYAGEVCDGVNLHVVDRSKLEPGFLGIQLAATLRRLYPEQWSMERFDRLLINKSVYDAIAEGRSADEIRDRYKARLNRFRRDRQRYFLY